MRISGTLNYHFVSVALTIILMAMAVNAAFAQDSLSNTAPLSGQTSDVVFQQALEEMGVTFTDDNGCTASNSTTVTVYPKPSVEITGYNSQCYNTNDGFIKDYNIVEIHPIAHLLNSNQC